MSKKILLVGHSVRPMVRQLAALLAADMVIFKEDLEQAKEELLKVGFLENEIKVIPSLAIAAEQFALGSGLTTNQEYLERAKVEQSIMEIKNYITDLRCIDLQNSEINKPRRTKSEDPFSRSYKGRKKRF